MRKAEVEIIPWIHRLTLRVHRELIEHINTLPKNSPIGIEIAPKRLARIESFFSESRNASKSIMLGTTSEPEMDLAVFELVFACKNRNLSIIPLETPIPLVLRERSNRRGIEYADEKRERVFARQLELKFKKFRGKIPVVVGAGHAVSLSNILNESGINARINTDFFSSSEKKKIVDLMYHDYYYSRAFKGRNYLEAAYWDDLLKGVSLSFERKSFGEAVKALESKFGAAVAAHAKRLRSKQFEARARPFLIQRKNLAKKNLLP